MVNFVTSQEKNLKDRNGKTITIGNECLFKKEGNIGQGKVIGYTQKNNNIYIISGSFGTVTTFKRASQNVVMVENLSKWNHKGSWYY